MFGDIRLSIVMPVRNDAPSVSVMARVLGVIVRVPCEILVVYDSFDDATVPTIRAIEAEFPRVRGVLNDYGAGVLNAVRTGVEAAQGKYVLIYAADEIGPMLAIDAMLKLMDRGCDFVSATRYAKGGKRYGGSLAGHIASYVANRLFWVLSCTTLSDCTTGMKMFRRDVFSQMTLSSGGAGWAFAFEMAIQAQVLGFKLGEVSVVSIDRLFGGVSGFKFSSWMLSYFRKFLYGVRKLPPWRRPRPILAFPTEKYFVNECSSVEKMEDTAAPFYAKEH
jgi:dolichol-phosphate mannosyltransferase